MRLLGACSLSSMVAGVFFAITGQVASADPVITLDPFTTYQTLSGWEWHEVHYEPESLISRRN